MPTKSYRAVIRETLGQEMRNDPRVFLMGEDLAGGMGGSGSLDSWGGANRTLKGLVTEFGVDRVIDTPISESAFLGAGAGAAIAGLRPVVEIMFCDFFGVCFDQVLNNISKFRYMSDGQLRTPITIRTTYGAGLRAAAQHSQSIYALFAHIPGLKIALPSCPFDVKGLLASAIRDENPVVFFEHRMLMDDVQEVPDDDYVLAFGEAKVVRSGSDATIVALGRMVRFALEAAELLASENIDVEVIDPRTIAPFDFNAVVNSVQKTGRLIIVDEANPVCSFAGHIAGLVASSDAVFKLCAPIVQVTAPDTPVPFAPNLEDAYIPGVPRIASAVRHTMANADAKKIEKESTYAARRQDA